jgi:3-methyladenine DNA glycosylase Tag
MKEAFRLQTDFSSSFDRWVSSFVSDHPAQLEWTTLKELIHEYTTSHTNDTLPAYISSAFTYYAQRVSTANNSEIVIFENHTIS